MEFNDKLLNMGLVILATLATLAVAKLISAFLNPKRTRLPPVIASWPVLGGLFRFLKGPVQMLREEYPKLGSVFTLSLLNKKITYFVGPEVSAHFFKASESDLSQQEMYQFNVPTFGPGVVFDVDYSVRQEQFTRVLHLTLDESFTEIGDAEPFLLLHEIGSTELAQMRYNLNFLGKSIRMMGVPKDLVDEILQNAKANLRIAGFEEEEKRMRQRMVSFYCVLCNESKNLVTGNSIIVGVDGSCKAKLTLLQDIGDTDLDKSIWRNIDQLRDMLVAAISFPFHQGSGVIKAQEKTLLKMTFVPYDLACFIGLLETPDARFIDIQWLLDESSFWTSEEKYLFVRKLYDIIVVMENYWAHSKREGYIKNKLEEMIFDLSSKDSRAVEVFLGRKVDEAERRSIGPGPDCFNFKMIIVFFRNMDEHCNDSCLIERTDFLTWTDFAIDKSVQELELDLNSTSFRAFQVPGFPRFDSPKALSHVPVKDGHVEYFRSHCPNLERLRLVELHSVLEDMQRVPRVLGAFSVFFTKDVNRKFKQFECVLSQLRTLKLTMSFPWITVLPKLDGLINLKNLELKLKVWDCDQPLSLCTSVIKALPFLHKFALHLFKSKGEDFKNDDDDDDVWTKKWVLIIEDGRRHCLRVVEYLGFTGCWLDFQIIQFVIKIAVSLEKMTVVPSRRAWTDSGGDVTQIEEKQESRKRAHLMEVLLSPHTKLFVL
ncbi:hypothetical protein RHGRI_031840 [Rhododendron griersonianum]|uniref:Cytochrome P450 n=1 Tax=Rhododendron griersonianum TaxID=479676 RepID=A0AAV6IF72_9ERIC|nr:hypothetical protein RHGRI_031840 [Rhododendron griersonianum]